MIDGSIYIGSFSSIFVAKSITEPKGSPHYYVAIKRQSSGFETVIRWESEVLKTLSLKLPVEGQGPIPVPRFTNQFISFLRKSYILTSVFHKDLYIPVRNM